MENTIVRQKKKSVLGKWAELTKPNYKFIFWYSVIQVIIQVQHIIEPVFAAKIITSLYDVNYKMAIVWLFVGLANIILRQVFCHIHYILLSPFYEHDYNIIQNKLFNKVLSVNDAEIKKISREKIINIVNDDTGKVSELGNLLITKSAIFLRVIVFLVLITSASWLAGLICVLLLVFNTFFLQYLSNKLGSISAKHYAHKDKITEQFTSVMKAKNIAKDFALTESLKEEYNDAIEAHNKTKEDYYKVLSVRDNWFYGLWNTFTTLITLFLIFLITKGKLSMENYLIVIAYLKDCFKYAGEATTILTDIQRADVSIMRINTMLNFSDAELIEFGKSESSDIYGELMFNNVSFANNSGIEKCGTIKSANLTISKNTFSVIHGAKGSGKRALFYLLRRRIKADQGVVTLNGIDVLQYSQKAYKEVLNFTTAEPIFLHDTIMKNFTAVTSDKNQIYKVCEILKIKDFIESLPNGFDTSILDDEMNLITPKYKFLIGLACSMLMHSRFILIYDLPVGLEKREYVEIEEILNKIKKTRTIVLFAHNKSLAKNADSVYKIENGVVKKEK